MRNEWLSAEALAREGIAEGSPLIMDLGLHRKQSEAAQRSTFLMQPYESWCRPGAANAEPPQCRFDYS